MKGRFAKGKPVDDSAGRACVLFDPKNGSVVHIHGMTALPGTKQISAAQLEKDAAEHAKSLGHSVAGLKFLHVPASAVGKPGPFKVNAQGNALEYTTQSPMRVSELLANWRTQKARE